MMPAMIYSLSRLMMVRNNLSLFQYLFGGWMLLFAGCSSTPELQDKQDQSIVRANDQGTGLYNLGKIHEAKDAYLEVLKRSWEIDDPYESGTAAYHLAACHFSLGEIDVAKDWLIDARYELTRANASCKNVWLLDAKIARSEKRYADVAYSLQRATSESKEETLRADLPIPRLKQLSEIRLSGSSNAVAKVRISSLRGNRDNQIDLPVLLIQASVAVEREELAKAIELLNVAEKLLRSAERLDLKAEWHRISAEYSLASDQIRLAAKHFDQEIECLKESGLYLDIPDALSQSSQAYERERKFDIAADRLCRAAKLYFGRSEYQLAWNTTQEAGRLSKLARDATIQVRLALVAELILSELPDESAEAHSEIDVSL
ncbi:MAG: hypothetical protein ISQ09_06950 [Rubripirellula sp.]|nr:hypothetical protein [Rubripirellula sp.]